MCASSELIVSQFQMHLSVNICFVIIDGIPLSISPLQWAWCWTFLIGNTSGILRDKGTLPWFLSPGGQGISSLGVAVKTFGGTLPQPCMEAEHVVPHQSWSLSLVIIFLSPIPWETTPDLEWNCLYMPACLLNLLQRTHCRLEKPSDTQSQLYWFYACSPCHRVVQGPWTSSGSRAKPKNFSSIQWDELHLFLKDLNPIQIYPSLIYSLSPRMSHRFP